MYADIIIDITHEKLDKVFQYRIPSHLEGMLKVGTEVVVPFGKGNKEINGYVTGFSERAEYAPEKIKEILRIAEESVAIESRLVALAAWMKESYGGTMIQALKTVLPIKKKERAKEKQKVRLLLTESEGKEKLELYLHKNQRARARLLAAKRILYTQGKTYEVPEEYTEITKEFLEIVDRKYHTDYRNNEELFTRLSVHIGKMIERIEQGYFETNPTLENVLEYYEREVRMAEELNQILQEKYQFIANVHEICYVAIYLKAYDFQRLKAVILCDIGESFADNMARQITDYCGEKIHILEKMSLAEYRLDPVPVDLVISGSRVYGVEFPKKTKIIYVDYLLKEENLKAIQEYLMKEGTDYDKDDCN